MVRGTALCAAYGATLTNPSNGCLPLNIFGSGSVDPAAVAWTEADQYLFNVIDQKKLIEAQKHPEEHRGLLVRVAGYTAYFTELGTDVQDEIIGRTVQHGISAG